jgi:homocysteine S-methyltransferase
MDEKRETQLLRRKLDSGTDFFLTQPVYDVESVKRFLEAYSDGNGALGKPILVGILPIFGSRHANFLHNEVPGISIPEDLRKRIEAAGDAGPQEGVKIAVEIIEQVRTWAQGVYLMPQFSRYDLSAEIIEAVK